MCAFGRSQSSSAGLLRQSAQYFVLSLFLSAGQSLCSCPRRWNLGPGSIENQLLSEYWLSMPSYLCLAFFFLLGITHAGCSSSASRLRPRLYTLVYSRHGTRVLTSAQGRGPGAGLSIPTDRSVILATLFGRFIFCLAHVSGILFWTDRPRSTSFPMVR